jgi:hypothetical protein
MALVKGRIIPPWLRHGIEAGIIGAMLSGGTLVAFQLSRPAPRLAIPNGLDGAMILLPAAIALGALAISYPTILAATRADAILGCMAAFLIAADALMAASFLASDGVVVHPLGRTLPLGVVAAALAVPGAIVGVLFGQLSVPLGFGRSAALRSALSAAIVGVVAVVIGAYLG